MIKLKFYIGIHTFIVRIMAPEKASRRDSRGDVADAAKNMLPTEIFKKNIKFQN